MKFSCLFEPATIGQLKLKNRLVMPPMVRNYATDKGLVTDQYIAHIDSIARGGVGMLILEASYISPEGKGFSHQLGIHSNAVLPGLKSLVDVVHKQKATIGIQLYHAGRQTSSKVTGQPIVGPSAVADPTTQEVPKALTIDEIKQLVRDFALATKRAKQAGFDLVEIHGAHGYLITQFLSSFSNKRTDEYGGSLSNRMRFGLEVISAVRTVVGTSFPIILRLSADELVKGGITLEETKKMACLFEQAGVDALHISVGNYASYAQGKMIPPMAVDDGVLVSYASEIKRLVSIPVIVVGKIRTPQMAEAIIKNKEADFIALGRTLLADPQWPNKVKEGKWNEVNPCIACNQGCISCLFANQDVQCTVNPETARESLFVKRKGKSKRVVVMGGGPAGMSAAKSAAKQGHRVTLYELTNQLGGQLNLAGASPYRHEWIIFKEALARDLKQLHVQVKLGSSFTPALAKKIKPDVVVMAIGSSARQPNLPGGDQRHVFTARDILRDAKKAKGDVVIVGGGCAGAQTAEFLASKGHHVTIIEAAKDIAPDAPIDERFLLLGRLSALGVKILTETMVVSIEEKTIVTKKHQRAKTVKASTVVLCLGSFSNDGFTDAIKKVVKDVRVVGDALEPRRVIHAVSEGALAGLC